VVFAHAPPVQASLVQTLPSSHAEASRHSTQRPPDTEVSQSGVTPAQPESVDRPLALSKHTTHEGVGAALLQMPPVQLDPAATGVVLQTPAEQVSVVHELPSLQSALVTQAPQNAEAPVPRQNGEAPPQPVSVPLTESFTQGAQNGEAPEVTQSGEPALQPASVPAPVVLFKQVTQSGAEGAPSHTPPAQLAPAEREVKVQAPATQASVVQAFASVQSLAPKQATQRPPVTDVSQSGVVPPQPESVPRPLAVSVQITQAGAVLEPLQMPPVHEVPAETGVFTQAPPAEQESLVQVLPSLQSAPVRQATQRSPKSAPLLT
jgi:hypothetical protein